MLIITKENNSIKVVGQNNPTYPYSGTLVYPLNSVTVVTDQSNMAVFRSALNNDVLFTGLIDDITIAGSTVTKEDIGTKFGAISNSASTGGGTGGGGAVDSVNGQTGTVVLSASDVNAYSKVESDGKYATKAEIPSTDNLATKQELAGEVSEREKQDSALGGMIAGETEAREQAITNLTATVQGKLDTATYNSEKATFETKENAAATYQPKGSYLTSIPEEYVTDTELNEKGYATQEWVTEQGYLTEHQDISGLATKEELNGKQDVLVSGTNIKTINSQSLLGEGNIEITVQGGGITDAPNDGKLYGRKSAQWSEVVIPDTSNLATKGELGAKLDTATYNEEKATFALKTEIPNISNLATKTELTEGLAGKANTSDLSNYLTTANAQSTYATKSELGAKLDVETYNSEKATFALKSELPDTSDFITKATADETYQPKGEYLTSVPENYVTDEELNGKGYATTAQLNTKQDALVSGTNIKTINGNTILGEGNIQIEGGGGISDAPSDDKTYGRKNGAWSEITAPDLSNYALKSEVPKQYVINFTGTNNGFSIRQTGDSDTLGGLTFGEGFTVVNSRNTPYVSINTETIATKEDLAGKQDTLVSGTNIKTVNGNSLLGSGDITIEGGGSDITAQYYSTSHGVQLSKDSANLLSFAPGDNITFTNSGSENAPIITISATGGGTSGGGTETYDFKGTSRCAELTYDVVKEGVILQNIALSDMNITTNGVLITLAKFDNNSAVGFALLSEGKYTGTNKPFLAQVLFSNVGGATISKYVSTTPTVQEGGKGAETNYIYSDKDNSMYRAIAMASPGTVADGEGGSTAGIVLRYWGDDVTNPLKFDYATSTRGGMMRKNDKAKLDTLQTEWFGTQSQFDGLEAKDENTLYFITEE